MWKVQEVPVHPTTSKQPGQQEVGGGGTSVTSGPGRQKSQDFRVTLGYIGSWRPAVIHSIYSLVLFGLVLLSAHTPSCLFQMFSKTPFPRTVWPLRSTIKKESIQQLGVLKNTVSLRTARGNRQTLLLFIASRKMTMSSSKEKALSRNSS